MTHHLYTYEWDGEDLIIEYIASYETDTEAVAVGRELMATTNVMIRRGAQPPSHAEIANLLDFS